MFAEFFQKGKFAVFFISKGRIFFEKKRAFDEIRLSLEYFNLEKNFKIQSIILTFSYKLNLVMKNLEISYLKMLNSAFMKIKSFSNFVFFTEKIWNKEIVDEQIKFRKTISEKDKEISRLEFETKNLLFNVTKTQCSVENDIDNQDSDEQIKNLKLNFEKKIKYFDQENIEIKRKNELKKARICKFVAKMNGLFEVKEKEGNEIMLVKSSSFKRK